MDARRAQQKSECDIGELKRVQGLLEFEQARTTSLMDDVKFKKMLSQVMEGEGKQEGAERPFNLMWQTLARDRRGNAGDTL